MVDYSILILSCDKYSSLWQPFFLRFNKYWPNKKEPRYLITNHKEPIYENTKTICIGEDVDWSSNLLRALEQVNSEYVFIILDDVFLKRAIDQKFLSDILNFIQKYNPNYLNTKPRPKPRGPEKGDLARELVKGSHYRSSITNAFWKKEILQNILIPGESPWQFEKIGVQRSNIYSDFYGTKKSLLFYDHIVVGGYLARDILDLSDVKSFNLKKSFPPLSPFSWNLYKIVLVRNKLFSMLIPQSYQQSIRQFFLKFLF